MWYVQWGYAFFVIWQFYFNHLHLCIHFRKLVLYWVFTQPFTSCFFLQSSFFPLHLTFKFDPCIPVFPSSSIHDNLGRNVPFLEWLNPAPSSLLYKKLLYLYMYIVALLPLTYQLASTYRQLHTKFVFPHGLLDGGWHFVFNPFTCEFYCLIFL